MESHSIIESALQPVNADLARIVYNQPPIRSKDSDIHKILKLMASIRTHALDQGWDQTSDRDLDEAKSILQRI
jgi:hypothetical protein